MQLLTPITSSLDEKTKVFLKDVVTEILYARTFVLTRALSAVSNVKEALYFDLEFIGKNASLIVIS